MFVIFLKWFVFCRILANCKVLSLQGDGQSRGPEMARSNVFTEHLYRTFAKLSQSCSKIYSFKLGNKINRLNMFAVFLTDPQLVRQAFRGDVFSGRAPFYLTQYIMKTTAKIICF